MRLSQEEIEQYHRDGYIVPRGRLSRQWQLRLRGALDKLKAAHPDVGTDFVPSPHIPNYVPGVADYEEWLAGAHIAEVADCVTDLIGADFLMWGSALFGKPGGGGKATPMHQDGEYWPIRPLASVTVWIALDPSTAENGCLRVVPGSHRDKALYAHQRDDRSDWTLNQVIDDEHPRSQNLNLDSAVDVLLEPGQFSIHDVYLVHGSACNNSEQARAGLTYRYMPTTSTFDHELAAHMYSSMGTTDLSDRPLFMIRGIDRSGKNDLKRGHHVYTGIA